MLPPTGFNGSVRQIKIAQIAVQGTGIQNTARQV